MPVILALRLRKENHELEGSLGYKERLCLKKKKWKRKEREAEGRGKGETERERVEE
jgi:hypothetical protein